ncbi:DsbA family protein [Pelosinus sp. sgz500959]|uniref:DsbA family oxidoreductase n=1 Tax=Pelosinus sp. sgz500959 TaxID=3242472 RepID=UPI00366FE935
MSLPLRIVFDFTCPYCYIAWSFVKKLKESVSIEDEWVSWEIHPDIPREGAKIQDVVQGIDMTTRRHKLNALGEPVGITPGAKEFVPNTRLALEVLEFAKENNKMHEWIDRVYHASFVEGKNIGDKEVLLHIAEQIGLDVDKVCQALDSGHYTHILQEHDQECVEKKIEWVPTIFSGDEKILEGVFTFTVFEEAICSRIG